MSNDRQLDPVASLRRLGAASVDVSDDRLDALGDRIAAAIDDDRADAAIIPLAPRRRRRGATIGLAAACVALVIATAVFALRPGDDTIVIAAADGVRVTLDDGTMIAGDEGLELPDGATLDVAGFVIVDGERFGPGTYRVDDGAVELVESSEPTTEVDDADSEGITEIAPPSTLAVGDDDADGGDDGSDSGDSGGAGDSGELPADTEPVATRPTTTAIDATSATRPPQTDAPTTTVRGPDETRPPERTSVPTTETRPATTVATTTPPTRPPTTTTEPIRPTDETRPERTTTTTTEPVRDR